MTDAVRRTNAAGFEADGRAHGKSVPATNPDLPFRPADFASLAEALDYAANGSTGINFYSSRGRLEHNLSYGDVRRRARALARHLLGLGLERGDRIAIVADMHPGFVCSFFACQYAGLVAVPLPVPTGLGGRESYVGQLRRVLETSGARIALGSEALLDHLNTAVDGLALDLITTVSGLTTHSPSTQPLQPLGGEEPSHIQYSSGSTRNPLGILITQNALMANAQAVARHGLQLGPGDRAASWLPFYHDMGLVGFLLIPVACQMTSDYVYTDGFARRPLQWLKVISDNRCTLAFSPTFGYELCVRRAANARELDLDLSSWRVAGIGGEMVRSEVLADFASAFSRYGFRTETFVPSYGLAEATLAFSFAPLDIGITVDRVDKESLVSRGVAAAVRQANGNGGDRVNGINGGHSRYGRETRAFATCGRPLPGYAVEVRNDAGARLPDRHVGRICIKGPSLMIGYDRDPEATARAIDAGGWLDTGDMGYLADGVLVITGRRKDLIIANGRNIWPQDLEWHAEQKIEELRDRDTAAFSVEDGNGKERPVILVQCRVNDGEARERLRSAVHSAIFRNAGIDCRVVLVPPRSLPFTTSGKLSRAKAKQAYLEGFYDESKTLRPTTIGRLAAQAPAVEA